MKSLLNRLRSAASVLKARSIRTWKQFRGLKLWAQALIVAAILAVIIGGIALASSGGAADASPQERTVTLSSVSSLSGNGDGVSILGTVQSISEAQLSAQAGGTVKGVYAKEGSRVAAGSIIAELDNASEAATVLQAQGAYDAAVASRNITSLQSGNTQTSFAEAQTAARATYRSAFTAVDSTLTNDVGTFFGNATPIGPQLLISAGTSQDISRKRAALTDRMDAWGAKVATADSADPTTLLAQATTDTQAVSAFLSQLSVAANQQGSDATAAQLAALARARGIVDGQLSALSAARDAYNAKKTAAQVGATSSNTGTQLAVSDASVKQALGALRGAQANLEKTRIRATIGGTLNFLSLHVGDYVGAFTHVATVAQNGALEIVAYIPEQNRDELTPGMTVTIEGGHTGTVTSVNAALDPVTKQIEVHVAVQNASDLVNGQSVRISFPQPENQTKVTTTATSTATTPTVQLLPLTALKLMTTTRAVFTVDADGRLVAHNVTIGDVVGDRIQVTTPLDPTLMIVTDVRGLSEGEKVLVSTSTPAI
ncbi:MAG: Efflux transporter, family [Parcubacteria group bacterium]|nr:Efflux transporter, family [Parcubacteria group bacterium]